MKSLLFSLFLIIGLTASEKISLGTRACLRKRLGPKQAKSIFSGYVEYRANNKKASLKEYVSTQKPTFLSDVVECLEKSERRRRNLTKSTKQEGELLLNDAKLLAKKLLKDKTKKKAILEKLKTTNASRAKQVCLNYLNSPNVCQYVVETLAKEVSK